MSCETTVVCKSEQRRFAVRKKEKLYGLDYVEVSDDQLTLILYFLGKAPPTLEKENIHISGGRRVTGIKITNLEIRREEDPQTDDCVHITVDQPGDFSNYCLCLIDIDPETKAPIVADPKNCTMKYRVMAGFDKRYSCVEFVFKTNCSSDLDCRPEPVCSPRTYDQPDINYLAKDYASFRQLILDRLALTMPDWKERHVPDLGMTLVEMLAYVGDHLSYYQDAVATEAYLDTARRRVSVRRHARLVDYQLHEGCNARTWVTLTVSDNFLQLRPADFYLISGPASIVSSSVIRHEELPKVKPLPYLIFEPLVEDNTTELNFYSAHNQISIYTWGDSECCLPKGATSATLADPGTPKPSTPEEPPAECRPADKAHQAGEPLIAPGSEGHLLHLKRCDVVIFEEIRGPKTGNMADANPQHRHAVRLSKATPSQDLLTGKLIWEIEWLPEDALPFSLCLSSINPVNCETITDITVVRGNVLLVDHGKTVEDDLSPVPGEKTLAPCENNCIPRETIEISGDYQPFLPKTDLTFSQPLPPCEVENLCLDGMQLTPATGLLMQKAHKALPNVMLAEQGIWIDEATWRPKLSLLSSNSEDRDFVVEMEEDRRAQLRFGNGELGKQPKAATQFKARFRIGNGGVGNIGANALSHMVFKNNFPSGIDIVPTNPFPAQGGTNPESLREAKLYAPHQFKRRLERAITADDYAQIVMRDFKQQVQRAAAKIQWSGSWSEVLVAIDPIGTETAPKALLCEIEQHLNRYSRIQHELIVTQAKYVSLEIAISVCVLPHYLKAHVKAALLDVFGNRINKDGGKGFFHPDHLSFGEGIYLSKLVAVAQAVEGVESVVVTTLKRQFEDANQELPNGVLPLGPLEIARLDNDPNFPEHGKLTLDMRGGR